MDKDKQRLLQKIYEAIHMCEEQDLKHEQSLLGMAAGCIEDDLPDYDYPPGKEGEAGNELTLDEMEDQDWYDTEEERLKKEKT